MATYTVHAPPGTEPTPEGAARVCFVKEGFSFWALVLPVVWLLWHRLWLALLGYLLVVAALVYADRFIDDTAVTIVAVLFAFWFALEARQIRRWTYDLHGWRMIGLVEADGQEAAEFRFFSSWADAAPVASPDEVTPPPPPVPPPAPRGWTNQARSVPSGIIGLFPDTKGR